MRLLRELALISELDGLRDAALSGGLALFESPGLTIVALRPLIRSEGRRPHCATGPAIEWLDGTRAWFWHGVSVQADIVERPELITLERIDREWNSEVQRVMIERFGWDRFAAEVEAEIIDHDERWGTLYRRKPPRDRPSLRAVANRLIATRSEPVLFLKVVNRSPEPDGRFRHYVLPVHPELRPLPDVDRGESQFGEPQALTALNAVASTFGMRGGEYAARLRAES